MATTPVVYDSASQTHRPLGAGEALGASALPVSSAAGNLIETRPDGLYAGVPVQNAVLLAGDQTVDGSKTFVRPIVGSLNGEAQRALRDGDGAVITERYERVDDLVTLAQIDAMFA